MKIIFLAKQRHGAFVWDQFPATEVDRMLHHYGIVADRSQQTSAKPNSKNPNTTKPASQAQPNGGDACTPAAPKASSKRASPVATAAQPKSKQGTDCTATVAPSGKSDNLVNTVQGGGGASAGGEAVQLPPIYA